MHIHTLALVGLMLVAASAADGKGELRIGSICTATIVPAVPDAPLASAAASGDALEALDHARGK